MKIIFSILILLDVVQHGSAILGRKQALPNEYPITDTSTLNHGVCNFTGNAIKNFRGGGIIINVNSKTSKEKKLQSHLFMNTNLAKGTASLSF